jgi:Uncharacterised protein family (UPF0014)
MWDKDLSGFSRRCLLPGDREGVTIRSLTSAFIGIPQPQSDGQTIGPDLNAFDLLKGSIGFCCSYVMGAWLHPLGGTRYQALLPVLRDALRSGFMPTINGMAAIGLVSLPGMMTGQILAGVEPIDAVKYQLLIMFLIAGGTGLGTVVAVMGGGRLLTDHRHRFAPGPDCR